MSRKDELEAQRIKIANELSRIEDKECEAEALSLVGRYFKYTNSYGSGSKPWPLYCHVLAFERGCIITHEFQTTSHDEMQCQPRRKHYRRMHSGFAPIRRSEFDRAWDKFKQRISSADL